jgi:hypothetical protein
MWPVGLKRNRERRITGKSRLLLRTQKFDGELDLVS